MCPPGNGRYLLRIESLWSNSEVCVTKHSNAMHIDAALTSSQDCIIFKQQQLTSRVSVVWCRRNVFSLDRSPRCRPKSGVSLAYPHSSARNCISRILKVLHCNSPDKCMSPKSSVCKAGNGSRDTSARHSKNLKIPCATHYAIDKDSLGTFTLWWQNRQNALAMSVLKDMYWIYKRWLFLFITVPAVTLKSNSTECSPGIAGLI